MKPDLQPPALPPIPTPMQPLAPRQQEILRLARELGQVEVDDLSARFEVSPQTIRKDLNELCEAGVLQRFHGGAMAPSGIANVAYEARRQLATEAKRLIGARTAALIPDGSSLLLNIGTTTEQVAMALRARRGLMVITNNINVANILRGYTQNQVILAGGVVRHNDGGVVGEAAVDFIRQFRADYAVIGTSAIDADGSLLDYDYREVKVARAIIEGARRKILVADSMKYARSAPVRIGHISEIDHFVTDAPPPPVIARILADHEVALEVCTAS